MKCIKHKLISTLSADNTENGPGVKETLSLVASPKNWSLLLLRLSVDMLGCGTVL